MHIDRLPWADPPRARATDHGASFDGRVAKPRATVGARRDSCHRLVTSCYDLATSGAAPRASDGGRSRGVRSGTLDRRRIIYAR